MPAPRKPPPPPLPQPLPPPAAADVILDVDVRNGTLHFVLHNIGLQPAHAVRVRFSRVLRDVAGLRVGDNPLYTQLAFLAPGRQLALFVDTLAGYMQRRQPMQFDVRLTWCDDAGRPQHRSLSHDLTAHTQLRSTL
jgi:hypothetical protein